MMFRRILVAVAETFPHIGPGDKVAAVSPHLIRHGAAFVDAVDTVDMTDYQYGPWWY